MPDSPIVLNNLGWILATHADASVRNGAEAVRYAERACALVGEREATFLGTLAAAYAEAGRFEEAARTATRAIATAEQNGQSEVVAVNQRLLELYKASKPYRSVSTNSPAP
jgi:tetratricopeptide (TPR) repeat protein